MQSHGIENKQTMRFQWLRSVISTTKICFFIDALLQIRKLIPYNFVSGQWNILIFSSFSLFSELKKKHFRTLLN